LKFVEQFSGNLRGLQMRQIREVTTGWNPKFGDVANPISAEGLHLHSSTSKQDIRGRGRSFPLLHVRWKELKTGVLVWRFGAGRSFCSSQLSEFWRSFRRIAPAGSRTLSRTMEGRALQMQG
jgi:hypothetical protein